MRLSNLHQNQRRMCTMWVCYCFLLDVSFGDLSKCQITQCYNFHLVKQRGSDRHCIMQTCHVGHVESNDVLHTRTVGK